MTNKTRKKFEDRKTKLIREMFEITGLDYESGFLDEKLLLLKVINKIENRILRKWRKAINKAIERYNKDNLWTSVDDIVEVMKEELLKAKGE